MTQEEKFLQMTTAPIPKLMGELAFPTIISMLVTSFYNMADTYFVGKINTSATAAVGIVFTVMTIIQAVGFFFGHGSGNYISRKLGEQKYKEANIMAANGFFLALLFGGLITVFGISFLTPLAYLLGSTDTILPYAEDYMRIILIGAPYMTASLVLNNQLRFQGSAFYGMIGIVSGAVVNIALDPILMFGLNMGISGAALATIISQFVSFCLLIAGTQKGENIRISIKKFRPTIFYIKEIFRGGLPSLCRQGITSVSAIGTNFMAQAYGDAAIAGLSIVSRITMFANSTLIGFGQGFQPICGFNYGAKIYRRVREAYLFCVKYATVFISVVAVIAIIFAPDIVSWFRRDDAEVIKIGTLALRLQCLAFPLNSWIVLCNMMLQSTGRTLSASLLAMARQGLFYLPFLFALSPFGLLGIQMTQPIADLATFALALVFGLKFLSILKEEQLLNGK